MGFCFQTSLLQPATHILQAILMFLESPPNNNHIIQISRTCGPLNSCQNQIHVPLRGARGIAETKRRHVKLREWDTLSLDKLLDESALGRSHRAHLERSALGSSSACLLFLSPSLLVLSCSEKGWPFKPSLLRRAPALLRPPEGGWGAGCEEAPLLLGLVTRACLLLILLIQCREQWDLNPCFGSQNNE